MTATDDYKTGTTGLCNYVITVFTTAVTVSTCGDVVTATDDYNYRYYGS